MLSVHDSTTDVHRILNVRYASVPDSFICEYVKLNESCKFNISTSNRLKMDILCSTSIARLRIFEIRLGEDKFL